MSMRITSFSNIPQSMDAVVVKEKDKKETDWVVYKKSSSTPADNAELIEKLKADSEKRVNQFKRLVTDMFLKQGKTIEHSDEIWKKLANGEFEVDQDTAKKAEKEISDDGYWGVAQTSERIFSFAKALSGGDTDKMNSMLDAFKEGFEQATKAWGKELPEISQKTYGAVLKKFEEYSNTDKNQRDA